MSAGAVSADPVAAIAEKQSWITSDAEQAAQSAIQQFFHSAGCGGERLLSILHGEFLHEPLHAVITDVPIGAWTVAVVFDLFGAATGDRTLDKVADGALKLGVCGALLAAAAGAADWSEIKDKAPRRIGSVHALLNIAATGVFALSWAARSSRRTRTPARLLALTAYAVASVSAHLGGNLVYEHGTGLRHRALQPVSADARTS